MPIKIISQAHLVQHKPKVAFPSGLRLADHMRPAANQGGRVYEFIGTDTFNSEWYTRRQFEVDAGRLEVPVLYTPIYETISDPNLPRILSIQSMGPGGVVFEQVYEGGEVKFASVTSSQKSVELAHFGVGLEYSDDLIAYNELWNVPIVERAMGQSYNALLNHMHLYPIISATYAAGNLTGPNPSGGNFTEDMFLTIEDAITAARTDTTNPRRGPYALLVSSANLFALERALTRVPQLGFGVQSSALDMVQTIIAYDGWTGTRGNKTTTYTGVTANEAYLISLQYRGQDFVSYQKSGLQEYGRDEDVSRFLLQVIWDCRFGVYANPAVAVQKITLPS